MAGVPVLRSGKFYDLENGLPVTTGPYRVVQTSPQQLILNRADSWWAVDQRLVDVLPEVLQLMYLPNPGETQRAQALICDRADSGLDFRPRTMREILERNPNVITHSGFNPPYGYVDWWPIGMFFNDAKEPYNDKRVRWAISYYIDREQLIDVAYFGAAPPSQLPLPTYAPLQRYFDVVEEKLDGDYNTIEYNPAKGDAPMTEAGFAKNADGVWEKDGNPLICDLIGVSDLFNDIGPILKRQLENHGLQTSYSKTPDCLSWHISGEETTLCVLRGHGSSVRDPYFTMNFCRTSETAELREGHQLDFSLEQSTMGRVDR